LPVEDRKDRLLTYFVIDDLSILRPILWKTVTSFNM